MSAYIDPERAQFEAFKALPRDQPIQMLNLIRLRAAASYPDGQTLSGREAYSRYGEHSAPIFQRVGGEIVWRGRPEAIVIGPMEEIWDLAFIAHYPSAGAFLEMLTDPDYRLAVKHRQAAVSNSRLIRMAPLARSDNFADS